MGWKACYNVMGIFGLFFGLLGFLIIREPARDQMKNLENEKLQENKQKE